MYWEIFVKSQKNIKKTWYIETQWKLEIFWKFSNVEVISMIFDI